MRLLLGILLLPVLSAPQLWARDFSTLPSWARENLESVDLSQIPDDAPVWRLYDEKTIQDRFVYDMKDAVGWMQRLRTYLIGKLPEI